MHAYINKKLGLIVSLLACKLAYIHFRLPMHTLRAMHLYTSAFSGPSSSLQSGPHYCPWLTVHHVVHLVKISKNLIGYLVSHGQVGGGGPG